MRRRNKTISRPVVIAVEGLDYLNTILNQIKKEQSINVDLWDFKEELSIEDNFDTLLKESSFVQTNVRALGIIVDAEESRDNEEKRIQGLLRAKNLPVPNRQLEIANRVSMNMHIVRNIRPDTPCASHCNRNLPRLGNKDPLPTSPLAIQAQDIKRSTNRRMSGER